MTTISVVILCWNSEKRLERLFPSLRETIAPYNAEVILVDNGSEQEVEPFAGEYGLPGLKVLRLRRNRGVAYGRNRGIEAAKGEYVWILDDDTEVNPSALATMLTHMKQNPKCGVCGCRLTDADGIIQESYKPFPGLGLKLRNILRIKSKSPYLAELAESDIVHPVYLIGACQLIRHEVILKTGLLDECIFYGPEDADFCLRVVKAGYTVDYLTTATIIHHWRRLTTTSPFSTMGRKHIKALFHFWHRHKRFF